MKPEQRGSPLTEDPGLPEKANGETPLADRRQNAEEKAMDRRHSLPTLALLIAVLMPLLPVRGLPFAAGAPTVVLEWDVPLPEVQRDMDGRWVISLPGYLQDERPGVPRLPYTTTLIALPPGANPALRVTHWETATLPLPGDLAVNPPIEADPDLDLSLPDPMRESDPVSLQEIGMMRGIRLARVVFRPLRVQAGGLEAARRVRVEIELGVPVLAASPAPLDPLQQQIARHVRNPTHAIPVRPRPMEGDRRLGTLSASAPTAFIEVGQPGIYRLTDADLRAVGLGDAVPSQLRLFRGSEEIATLWQGDEDPQIETGEALLFYAEPRPSRWTAIDVYRLTIGPGSGIRMASRPAVSGTLPVGRIWIRTPVERNLLYMPDRLIPGLPTGRDGDRWAWSAQIGPASEPTTYPFSLANVRPDQPALLTLWLIGYTNTPHRWAVRVNGVPIGEATWSGKTAITATFPISKGILQGGTNALSLQPLNTEGGWLDAFEIRYARSEAPEADFLMFEGEGTPHRYELPVSSSGPYIALDITDPMRPVQLVDASVQGGRITLTDPADAGGRRYALAPLHALRVPLRIRPAAPLFLSPEAPSGADIVIITHPDLAGALSALRVLRESQGMRVAVANVLGIYDAYGDGRMDPEAIRRFIRDLYVRWNPRPLYVLLVGDGTFDPKRYRASSPPTYIPPYLADVDPKGGETAADNRYVAVDGEDNVPDLIIGRIPARTLDETAQVVAKLLAYEGSPFPGGWNARVILVADDADSAGDFHALSEASASFLTAPYTPIRLYCVGASPTNSDCPAEEAGNIRRRLLSEWENGALIVQFAGHASWQQWALERFLHLEDLPSPRNDRRLPIVLGMTCFTGSFHRPEPTLDEALLLQRGGAVATWGSTGLGIAQGHDRLSHGFFEAVFEDAAPTVGAATFKGKLRLLQSGQHLDLLDTFVLLGDPATRIDRMILPWSSRIYLPLILR